MEVTHWVLHQGWCLDCGRWDASPSACRTCEWVWSALQCPRWGAGRDLWQRPPHSANFCASVLRVPISLGAIQKVLDRVTQAIEPYYSAIATQARQAPVNYIDETPWYCLNTLEWLWVMASERVAFYMIHPRRSKESLCRAH